MRLFSHFALISAFALSSLSAQAGSIFDPIPQEDPVAWSHAVSGHHGTGYELDRGILHTQTSRAIGGLIAEATNVLRAEGHLAEAQEIENGWENMSAAYFALGIDVLDIGDYAPLNAWFADTYKRLRDRFGGRLSMIRILDDLNTLNYTIPVVFQPRGNARTQEVWSSREYKMHFIPFSGVTVYWGSFIACKIVFRNRTQIGRYCKRAANMLSRGMTMFVAPRLADRIYNRANLLPYEIFTLDLDQEVARYQYAL